MCAQSFRAQKRYSRGQKWCTVVHASGADWVSQNAVMVPCRSLGDPWVTQAVYKCDDWCHHYFCQIVSVYVNSAIVQSFLQLGGVNCAASILEWNISKNNQ